MRSYLAAALALIASSSLCAQTVQPSATPAPTAIANLGSSIPITGNWSYARTSDGSEATFTDASNRPQLWLRCNRTTRQVNISKPAAGAAPFLDFWTSSQTRSVPASFNPTSARISVTLVANDPLLDAMAFSRGRVGVTTRGQAALVVPPWEEIARVVEDCRT